MSKSLDVQMFRCSDVWVFWYPNVQMSKCSYVRVSECVDVQMFKLLHVQMSRCSNVQMLNNLKGMRLLHVSGTSTYCQTKQGNVIKQSLFNLANMKHKSPPLKQTLLLPFKRPFEIVSIDCTNAWLLRKRMLTSSFLASLCALHWELSGLFHQTLIKCFNIT